MNSTFTRATWEGIWDDILHSASSEPKRKSES
jgi:hypothetical protein